jgi:hypothetical protein
MEATAIPAFDATRNLPPGIYRATLDAIQTRFGTSEVRAWGQVLREVVALAQTLQEISRRKLVLKTHGTGNRTGGSRTRDRAAGLGPGPGIGGTEAPGPVDLAGRGALCVAAPRSLTSIKHRLKSLEAKIVQDGILLTDAQIAALEKAKADKEASECPGYCGAQDTFYVGTLKGVGRVYQQTVIDTYAKVAFC